MARKKNLIAYKDEFIKLYNEGNSIREIARLYEVSKGSVARILDGNVEFRKKSSIVGKEDIIHEMFSRGASRSEISKSLGVTYSTVTNFLVKQGLVKVNSSKHSDLIDTFKEEYESGKSLKEISEKYNTTAATVHTYVLQEIGETRSYIEASRKYETNDTYFDTLNDQKAYQLGIIFELGSIYNNARIGSDKISLSSKNNVDLIFKALDGVTSKGERSLSLDAKFGTYTIYVSSTHLKDILLGYGMKSATLNIPNEFMDSFMSGFLTAAVHIMTRSIYISLGKSFEKSVLEYMDYMKIRYSVKNNCIIIHNKDGILKLLYKFPDIWNLIDIYLGKNPRNRYWIARKNEFK